MSEPEAVDHQGVTPIIDRLMAKVKKEEGGCWMWTGYLRPNGYGSVSRGRRHEGREYVHRVSYQFHKGPIPEGMQIDHLCRNRACVNPDHLEAVTNRENTLRGNAPSAVIHRSGSCSYGHEANEANSYIRSDGGRNCRVCAAINTRRRRAASDKARSVNP